MNKFRFLTAGESHGKGLIATIEGIPAGVQVREAMIREQLARRQRGYGRGKRQQIETDYAEIMTGVRYGKTMGTPIALLIENADRKNANWDHRMSIEDVDDHELNRVVIFNNKMSIKMDEEDILLSGIKFNSFENKINSYNVSIRALSVSNVSFIEMVNEYDLLEVQLQSKNEELNFIKSKFDRLNELYKAQGSVALKDIEKVKKILETKN